MSWVGLPGYDCGVCGAPSCSTAARLMEAGELGHDSCPFAEPEPKPGSPWVAEPSPPSLRRPCPSDRALVQAAVTLAGEGARYRPLDASLAARLMAAAGMAAAPALRGQLASARWGGVRVQAFASGRLGVRLRGSDGEALSALARVARVILPAAACQLCGLLEAEVAAGCSEEIWRSPCLPENLSSALGLAARGAEVAEVLGGDSGLAGAASSMASLREDGVDLALVEGVDRLSSGDAAGLWLVGIALEVERALKNDPRPADAEILSGVLSRIPDRLPDPEPLRGRAWERLSRGDRSARAVLSAANISASMRVLI